MSLEMLFYKSVVSIEMQLIVYASGGVVTFTLPIVEQLLWWSSLWMLRWTNECGGRAAVSSRISQISCGVAVSNMPWHVTAKQVKMRLADCRHSWPKWLLSGKGAGIVMVNFIIIYQPLPQIFVEDSTQDQSNRDCSFTVEVTNSFKIGRIPVATTTISHHKALGQIPSLE